MPKDLTSSRPKTTRLTFNARSEIENVSDPIHRDLSALALSADALFTACDETSGIDRLSPVKGGWGDHVHFGLGDVFDLPGGAGGEMDVEAVSVDGGWLWVTGSQSLKRDKGDLDAMAGIDWDPNRQFLGRVPLVTGPAGPSPVARDGERHAMRLKFAKRGRLRKWLDGDPHLGPFLGLPSKENGLDVEGMAVSGMRVWLGLRGPVLREHAVIVEMEMKRTAKGHLKPRRIDGGRRYRKHLIPTGGQGIRDLEREGDDILILTGTTMAGDGPSQILRWNNALRCGKSAIREVEAIADLPYRGPVDHPEGMARMADGRLMVVYDSPMPERVGDDPPRVDADIFDV